MGTGGPRDYGTMTTGTTVGLVLFGLFLLTVATGAVAPAHAVRVGPAAAGAFSDRYPVEIPVGNVEQVQASRSSTSMSTA